MSEFRGSIVMLKIAAVVGKMVAQVTPPSTLFLIEPFDRVGKTPA